MAKSQRSPINPPIYSDRATLTDFAKNIQDNMVVLYEAAHDHLVLPANPSSQQGSVQTISIVDTGTSVYLAVKTSRGWFKSPTFTAI